MYFDDILTLPRHKDLVISISLDLQQLVSAGLLVEPSAKVVEQEEAAATNLGILQQMTDDMAPETSTAAAPASSSTSALPVSTTAVAVEPPVITETTQVTAVIAEPPTTITEPATGMPTPSIAPPSVVPAAPVPNPGSTHIDTFYFICILELRTD